MLDQLVAAESEQAASRAAPAGAVGGVASNDKKAGAASAQTNVGAATAVATSSRTVADPTLLVCVNTAFAVVSMLLSSAMKRDDELAPQIVAVMLGTMQLLPSLSLQTYCVGHSLGEWSEC